MSFRGNVFTIDLSRGGFKASPNLDGMRPIDVIEPTRNIHVGNDGREKRGGTSKVNPTAVAGTPRIMGLYDFSLFNGSRFSVFATNLGDVYKNFTDKIKTGMSSVNYFNFATMDNELYITDGATIPQVWDGAAGSTSDITTPASDWTGSSYPLNAVVHGRGASQRMIYFTTPGFLNSLYISANGNGKNASSVKIDIDTGDGDGIVAGASYGERFICFSKKAPYILEDTNSDTALWGAQKAQWEVGGCAHQRLLIRTPNDLISMSPDGEIYSVTAVNSFGDYKAASISRPSFIHKWIRDFADLSHIEKFHGCYDPFIRAVRIWMVRKGQTEADICWKYYIDRAPDEAWWPDDNANFDSGFKASSSGVFEISSGDVRVRTGDHKGHIWNLEETSKNDGGNGFPAKFRTPQLTFSPDGGPNPRLTKKFIKARVVFNPLGSFDLTFNWWVDGMQQTSRILSTAGDGSVVGTAIVGTDIVGGQGVTQEEFDLGAVGERIQIEGENNVANEDFFLPQMLVDFKYMGAKP